MAGSSKVEGEAAEGKNIYQSLKAAVSSIAVTPWSAHSRCVLSVRLSTAYAAGASFVLDWVGLDWPAVHVSVG